MTLFFGPEKQLTKHRPGMFSAATSQVNTWHRSADAIQREIDSMVILQGKKERRRQYRILSYLFEGSDGVSKVSVSASSSEIPFTEEGQKGKSFFFVPLPPTDGPFFPFVA